MALNAVRRGFSVSVRRYISTSTTQCDKMMPDAFEHATGIEKQEMLAKRAGNNVSLHATGIEKQEMLAKRAGNMVRLPVTGIEKQEILAKRAGNIDPFYMGLYHRGAGTKESPNLIPSRFDCRIVGCVCEEDATCVNYMWLKTGESKRCECGHWFKLVEGQPLPALE